MIATGALWAAYTMTRERIAQTHEMWLTESLATLLPEGPFDDDPLRTVHWLDAPELGRDKPVPVYPVYKNNQPVAAILSVTTSDGYNGDITLLLGVLFSGQIIAAQVTEHRETPGLGDDIERRRSNWITHFNGHSLATTQAQAWTVRQSGGEFDAFTGATITPRAVIQAIHRALKWFAINRERVFTA